MIYALNDYNKLQTQLHVSFSCCHMLPYVQQHRWRHISIITTIIHHLKVAVGADIQLFAHCPNTGTNCTSTSLRTLRPDIVVILKAAVYVIELTVP